MQNVVLTVHLILAALLIGVVLLQRSEGGGLGLGGGGGGGVMSGRQAANALSKATWLLAAGFLVTSIALTVIAARNSAGGSVIDRITGTTQPVDEAPANLPTLPAYAPPPAAGQPILPPGAAAPAPAASAPVASEPVAVPPAPAAAPVTAPALDAITTVPMSDTPAPAGGEVRTITVPMSEPTPAN